MSKRVFWILLPVGIATACATIGDRLVPGTLNDVTGGLLAALYVVAGYALKTKS